MSLKRNRNIVGPQIRKLRYQHNWTQSDFATFLQLKGLDCDRCIVAKIEAQLHCVADWQLIYFAVVLGVTWQDLFPPLDVKKPLYDRIQELRTRRQPTLVSANCVPKREHNFPATKVKEQHDRRNGTTRETVRVKK